MLLSPRKSALHLVLLSVAVLLVPTVARAKLTNFVKDASRSEPLTFGGHTFQINGQAVQYEKIVGTACGELDPADPKNAVIVDLALAPRTSPAAGTTCAHPSTTCANPNGCVQYNFEFYILKPTNLSLGAHKVMYEPPNRGNKTWANIARFSGSTNNPGSQTDPAVLDQTFFLQRGYTIVFSGWDQAAGPTTTTSKSNFVTTITLPVLANVTGPAYEYIVTGGASSNLTYTANSLTKGSSLNDRRNGAAILTHRVHLDDMPKILDSSAWDFNAAGTSIHLNPSADSTPCLDANGVPTGATCFIANDVYEFMYTAKNPTVNTVGLAAIRDFNAWLRYETADSNGIANPLAGDVERIYTEVVSQPGRTLNDFRHLGFNQAENGKQVFDGMLQWIAAGDGLSMNFRFSQPGRTERNRQEHLFNEATFPFANVMTTDPITGQRDSRLARCEASHTCPVSMEIYSANEYWVKAASLLHTTPDGKQDLPDSPFARDYFISSHMHGSAGLNADGKTTGRGNCQQMQNPLNSAPIQRALWVAMDEWVTQGREPPATQVPTFHDKTLVPPDQASTGFPHIPGVTYTGLKTTRYRFDWGNGSNGPFYDPSSSNYGIPQVQPPNNSDGNPIPFGPPYEDNAKNGPIYPSFVSRTDEDGNDIAGVRLADVTVPLATYTGWALRAGRQANDGCESSGQFIPFAQTKADRKASGDPRKSVEERYNSLDHYVEQVAHALNKMVQDRVLLCEDYQTELTRLTNLGKNLGGLSPKHGDTPKIPNSSACK